MICPGCGSTEVRPSRRSRWGDLIPRMHGQQAYRCKKCRIRFQGAAGAAGSRGGFFQWRRRHGSSRGSRRRALRLVQAVIFLLMLFVFYLFLRYLTDEKSPSPDSRAPRWSTISQA